MLGLKALESLLLRADEVVEQECRPLRCKSLVLARLRQADRGQTCPFIGGMCCKTIFTLEMSNFDSRTNADTQDRFKIWFDRIQILRGQGPASSFATHSGAKRPWR